MEKKIKALIKAAGVNAEPFGRGWFERPWPMSTSRASSVLQGLVDPRQRWCYGCRESCSLYRAAPAEEKKMEAKKESEESEDDMDFGLFD